MPLDLCRETGREVSVGALHSDGEIGSSPASDSKPADLCARHLRTPSTAFGKLVNLEVIVCERASRMVQVQML